MLRIVKNARLTVNGILLYFSGVGIGRTRAIGILRTETEEEAKPHLRDFYPYQGFGGLHYGRWFQVERPLLPGDRANSEQVRKLRDHSDRGTGY